MLDYDGTLAPIVQDPGAAWPHPAAPALLERLAARHPLVVVTGRDLNTLAALLAHGEANAPALRAIGLHGAEEGVLGRPASRRPLGDLDRAMAEMRAALPRGDGIVVEEKGAGAYAVHYRQAPAPEVARALLEEWARAAPAGLEPIRGKFVVELRPAGVSKGVAVDELAATHRGMTPVYIGDDVTDEDAFAALNARDARAVTVRVGAGATAARYRLRDVDAVIEYLRAFCD